MESSRQWKDGHFENPQPLFNDVVGSITGWLESSPQGAPIEAFLPQKIEAGQFLHPPESGLRLTWLGHASVLIEIDGQRILTDPMWSQRSSPFSWIGPTRWYEPPIAITDLPPIDAVLISHDHYDHLDMKTILAMRNWKSRFIVPLGVGEHLRYWGIPSAQIDEVDWWDQIPLGGVSVVCTPARHASGRFLFDKDATLWAGYAIVGASHRVYFSGDTGPFPAMKDIGDRFGPFDVTMIEIGQYHRAWPDWHIGPEQAVAAHQTVRGKVMLPIHWALLTLAYHGWTEPAERVLRAAASRSVSVLLPRPGESIEPSRPHVTTRWWPELPWQTAEEHPIVSTGME